MQSRQSHRIVEPRILTNSHWDGSGMRLWMCIFACNRRDPPQLRRSTADTRQGYMSGPKEKGWRNRGATIASVFGTGARERARGERPSSREGSEPWRRPAPCRARRAGSCRSCRRPRGALSSQSLDFEVAVSHAEFRNHECNECLKTHELCVLALRL